MAACAKYVTILAFSPRKDESTLRAAAAVLEATVLTQKATRMSSTMGGDNCWSLLVSLLLILLLLILLPALDIVIVVVIVTADMVRFTTCEGFTNRLLATACRIASKMFALTFSRPTPERTKEARSCTSENTAWVGTKSVGDRVGRGVGGIVGAAVRVGREVGCSEGTPVGDVLGCEEGSRVGWDVG